MTPRNTFILIGAGAGAVLGALAAYAYFEQQERGLTVKKRQNGQVVRVKAGAGDLMRVAVSIVGIVREVAGMVKAA
jgi:hypothetical protein